MSTEQEQRNKLEELYHSWKNMAGVYFGEFMVANGVTVELPPEPQWKPGQYVWLNVTGAHDWTRLLARRNRLNDGWELIGVEPIFRDHEVTDVEPAVVLTAEDVRELMDEADQEWWLRLEDAPRVRGFLMKAFAERGVDVR